MQLSGYYLESLNRYKAVQSEIEEVKEGVRNGKSPVELETDKPLLEKRIVRLANVSHLGRERLIGNNDIVHINIIDRIRKVANTVGRIVIADASGSAAGYGTGFMVGPGLLLTNHHVIPDSATAAAAFIDFNYEEQENKTLAPYFRFKIKEDNLFITSPDVNGLDYTLVELPDMSIDGRARLDDFGWNRLYSEQGKAVIGEAMIVIQHPGGDAKKVAFRNNNLLHHFENFLQYETDTMPGSSGGLVANLGLEVVALHHSSVPRTDQSGHVLTKDGDRYHPNHHSEKEIDWIANEGVRISSIWNDICARKGLSERETKKLKELSGRPHYPDPQRHTVTGLPVATNTATPPMDKSVESPVRTDTIHIKSNAKRLRQRFLITIKPGLAGEASLEQLKMEYRAVVEPLLKTTALAHPAIQLCYMAQMDMEGSPWQHAQELTHIPGVEEAVPDLPYATHIDDKEEWVHQNGGRNFSKEIFLEDYDAGGPGKGMESTKNPLQDDWNEEEKILAYKKRFAGYSNVLLTRTWNHESSRFPAAIKTFHKKFPGRLKKIDSLTTRIAHLDTGYTRHPELELIQASLGRDFVDNDADAEDELRTGFMRQPMHGTRTASIIIGGKTTLHHEGNNGVFPYMPVAPFRVSNSVILLNRFHQVANAVHYAIENHFWVLSMSMGVLPGHRQWKALVKYAYDNGLIWINAAGNEVRHVVAPSVYEGTIAVAAVNAADQPWSGSCRGPQVDISAPGEDIYVPITNRRGEPDYSYGSGTSYATPHVAAAAVMWLEYHHDAIADRYTLPWQKVEAFRYCLQGSARPPKTLEKVNGEKEKQVWDSARYGTGILDANALLNHPLPAAESLRSAYHFAGFESTPQRDLSVEEMEILYHEFNTPKGQKDISLKEAFGATSGLSPRAAKLKEQLTADSSGEKEALLRGSVAEKILDY